VSHGRSRHHSLPSATTRTTRVEPSRAGGGRFHFVKNNPLQSRIPQPSWGLPAYISEVAGRARRRRCYGSCTSERLDLDLAELDDAAAILERDGAAGKFAGRRRCRLNSDIDGSAAGGGRPIALPAADKERAPNGGARLGGNLHEQIKCI
jgi:hypothetical protein